MEDFYRYRLVRKIYQSLPDIIQKIPKENPLYYLNYATTYNKPKLYSKKEALKNGLPTISFFSVEYAIIYPIEIIRGYKVDIIGFQIRDLKKKQHYLIKSPGYVDIIYGLHTFQSYEHAPIILVEGIKDQISVSRFYYHTLALLSSRLNKTTLNLLNEIKPPVVFLMLDNDTTGRKNAFIIESVLLECGIRTNILLYPNCFKDPGEMFQEDASKFLKNIIDRRVLSVCY